MDSACPKELAAENLNDSDHSTKVAPTTLRPYLHDLKSKCTLSKGWGNSTVFNGEESKILQNVKNTVIKKSSENNEEPHKPHIDTIIRSLKN